MIAKTVSSSDVERCPEHQLDAGHYRRDGTCLHRSSEATAAFCMNWENDYDLYQAVLRLGRSLRRTMPSASRRMLGQAVIDLYRPRALANAEADNVWGIMHRDVEHWDEVDPVAVGETVEEALNLG